MKLNSILQILTVWMFASSFSVYPGDTDKKNGQWIEARTSDGLKTYYRWGKTKEGNPFRERKGEMEIMCSLHDALKVLSDPQRTSEWMYGIEESKMLERPANNEWYTYTLFSMPWPFNQRDMVSLNRIMHETSLGITTIEVICRENHIPPNDEVIRLTDYRAQWRIADKGPNKIYLVFTAASSTPPAFPRYIQDPVIEKLFHNNLVRLKKLLEEKV